jgi:hypothetical protein
MVLAVSERLAGIVSGEEYEARVREALASLRYRVEPDADEGEAR